MLHRVVVYRVVSWKIMVDVRDSDCILKVLDCLFGMSVEGKNEELEKNEDGQVRRFQAHPMGRGRLLEAEKVTLHGRDIEPGLERKRERLGDPRERRE